MVNILRFRFMLLEHRTVNAFSYFVNAKYQYLQVLTEIFRYVQRYVILVFTDINSNRTEDILLNNQPQTLSTVTYPVTPSAPSTQESLDVDLSLPPPSYQEVMQSFTKIS